jgi:hypothetical protein
MAVQRAAADSRTSRSRPVGVGSAAVYRPADKSGRRSDRFTGVLAGGWSDDPTLAHRGRWYPCGRSISRSRTPAEPRRHPAARLERPRIGDDQHRLCGNRGRHASDEPHTVSALLPGEADVLPRRRRHLRIWPGAGRRPAALFQPASRAGGRPGGADHRGHQSERAHRQHRTSVASWWAQTRSRGWWTKRWGWRSVA